MNSEFSTIDLRRDYLHAHLAYEFVKAQGYAVQFLSANGHLHAQSEMYQLLVRTNELDVITQLIEEEASS